jgi:hypothetical protein
MLNVSNCGFALHVHESPKKRDPFCMHEYHDCSCLVLMSCACLIKSLLVPLTFRRLRTSTAPAKLSHSHGRTKQAQE